MSRILVVEDDIAISELITMNLTVCGYECDAAYDGMQALKVCYNKDGIIDFQTDSIYTVKKVDHTAKNLLTAEQALDKAYEEFTTVYTPAEITVEQMRFEYAPKAYNSNYDEVKLVPVWSMIVYQKDNNPEADEKRAIKRATEGKVYDENYHSTYAMNRHVWIIDAETGDVLKKSI